jgi:hypothetical protein
VFYDAATALPFIYLIRRDFILAGQLHACAEVGFPVKLPELNVGEKELHST